MASIIETKAIELVNQIQQISDTEEFLTTFKELIAAVKDYQKFPIRDNRIRNAAKEIWQSDGEIEIDDDAVVSPSENGAYVSAWVWVAQ
jgi:hypothetical protein